MARSTSSASFARRSGAALLLAALVALAALCTGAHAVRSTLARLGRSTRARNKAMLVLTRARATPRRAAALPPQEAGGRKVSAEAHRAAVMQRAAMRACAAALVGVSS